ncbi:MAG: 6-phosphofructokinase [Victivallaceae bacterium]|nr:6-phosphofructokinase [Victivallaceae bacterium]
MNSSEKRPAIGVLTSGGDAPGMNAAVRAVVRFGIASRLRVFAIYDGYQGMVDGNIKELFWGSVSGILARGGTVIGTARCLEFREESGLLKAALNLHKSGINKLVVIGGDGSLSGANQLREEWPELQKKLLADQKITEEEAAFCKNLFIVGLVGSIDNDMAETDMTIGADSALHRITESVDDLRSTALSHQRTFVVEVMGRNCGYLALMSAIATGASNVFIPEAPAGKDWKTNLCKLLEAGRKAGRRDNIIIVAEGARDVDGNPVTAVEVQKAIEDGLNIEARVTILGHVQRGGSPSAFDRYMSTACGCAAVHELINADEHSESMMVGLRGNRIAAVPLMDAVKKTRTIAAAIKDRDFDLAEELRGPAWSQALEIYRTLCLAVPALTKKPARKFRLGVMTCGWPAPGMNSAIRTVVRLGLNRGHEIIGIENGVEGLVENHSRQLGWMEVEEWNSDGGSKLGANRRLPKADDFYHIARTLDDWKLDGLLVIGGWSSYTLVELLQRERRNYPSFKLPMVCIPSTINNNLPASELSVGADTALNSIVNAVDQVKNSADSSRRFFMVEVMGRYCGYLATMSGIATGAEFVYLHEHGVTLDMMRADLAKLAKSFRHGDRRVALAIRNENANDTYTTDFMCSLYEEEGGDLFDVRRTVLGPLQQGGVPSPFDRIQGTRLAYEGINALLALIEQKSGDCGCVGQEFGHYVFKPWHELERLTIEEFQRPKKQWWLDLYEMSDILAFQPEK